MDLEEERLKKKAAALTLGQKILLYSLRVVMCFLAFGFIIGAFYGIFRATVFSQVMMHVWSLVWTFLGDPPPHQPTSLALKKQERSGQEGIQGLIFQYLPSIVITAGNFVVPMLCDQLARVERYAPSTTVILALLRFALVFSFVFVNEKILKKNNRNLR